MWDPKIDSPSSAGQAQPAAGDKKQLHLEDSGQIDSGFLSSEQILQSYSDDEQDQDKDYKKTPLPAIPIAGESSANAPVDQNQQKQQQFESDAYLDSGLIEDTEFLSGPQEEKSPEKSNDMLLERELDNGLAEWLCTLDLKTANSQGGAAAGQVSTGSVNNLGRRVECPAVVTESQGQTMNISAVGEVKKEMPEEQEQPWEMCYKQDADGDTYLHLAVSEGALDIVRDLIRITPHPCLLDIQNDLLQSALHLAVLVSHVRLVRMLLLAGAESSIRDKYGNTPLHLACAAGDLECVKALTERITATEQENAVSCTGVLVTKEGTQKFSRAHLVQYADVELRNYDGERCVHIAASVTRTEQNKHVDVMRELVVRSGADVNAREGKAGYTALHMAVERGDKDLVKFLLDECKHVNLEVASYGRWTAYQIATVNRNQELMSLLRSKGAEALDVSSSEESEDSDGDDNEILDVLYAKGTIAGLASFNSTVPCVGY